MIFGHARIFVHILFVELRLIAYSFYMLGKMPTINFWILHCMGQLIRTPMTTLCGFLLYIGAHLFLMSQMNSLKFYIFCPFGERIFLAENIIHWCPVPGCGIAVSATRRSLEEHEALHVAVVGVSAASVGSATVCNEQWVPMACFVNLWSWFTHFLLVEFFQWSVGHFSLDGFGRDIRVRNAWV